MSEGVLKAIKDWCLGKFQAKGNYLTEIPSGYVTETKLAESFSENMGGAKIAQDAEGKWGLLIPGDNTAHPFFDDKAQITGGTVMAGLKTVTVSVEHNSCEGYEQITV